MSRRGFCIKCQKPRWISGGNQLCRLCTYQVGTCSRCGKKRKIYVDGLCYCCYQDRQVKNKIEENVRTFQPKTDYNLYVFQLYLAYITRYRLNYFHLRQMERLKKILEEDAWPAILCWNDVYKLSAKYDLRHPNKKHQGCAVRKIGFMLEELGILSTKDEDRTFSIEKIIDSFENQIKKDITAYVNWLNRSNRAANTIYGNLLHLSRYVNWMKTIYPELEPFQVSEIKIIEHLDDLRKLRKEGENTSLIRDRWLVLRRFFFWLLREKKIFSNPCAGSEIVKIHPKINIISPSDYKKLVLFIKAPSSPSEEALSIFLFLFYGLKTEDILHAAIEIKNDDDFCIIFRQKPLTWGRHYYNRKQILNLPDKPSWLKELKKRFLKDWQENYNKTKKTFPTQRLILPRHHHYARPISYVTFLKRIYHITRQITGHPLPPKVLRQTCGSIYAHDGDGSILSTLGWSQAFAFHYTWLPRRVVSPIESTHT